MTKHIDVFVYRVGADPVLESHPDTLESWQGIVGGYIQLVRIGNGLVLLCDEEGKLKGAPPNRVLVGMDTIVGDFFVCRTDGEDFASVTRDDMGFLLGRLL